VTLLRSYYLYFTKDCDIYLYYKGFYYLMSKVMDIGFLYLFGCCSINVIWNRLW